MAALLLSAAVYVWPRPFLAPLGEYLVVKDPEMECDVIVLLSGSMVERSLAAADAYEKGLADTIITTRTRTSSEFYELKKRGVSLPEERDLEKLILVGLGVPEDSVLTIDRFVDSTLEEADAVKDFLLEEGYGSMVLVTSSYHSRRASGVFRSVLEGTGIFLVSYPSPYGRFQPDGWWKDRKAIQALAVEYQKIAAYLLAHGIF